MAIAYSRFIEPGTIIAVSLFMLWTFGDFVLFPNLGAAKLDWFATLFMSAITLGPALLFFWMAIASFRKSVPQAKITRTLLDDDEIDQIASHAPELMPLIDGEVQEYYWPRQRCGQ